MFRFRSTVLALVSFWMSGCTGSYCAELEHQSEPTCQSNQGGTVAAFTITPARIAIDKNSTTAVAISTYSNFENMPVTLKQGGAAAKLPLGNVLSDGTLKATIRASDLVAQGFVSGPAEVEIAGQRLLVRIFVTPKFDSSAFSAVHAVSNDHGAGNMAAPSWVGIAGNGSKKILTLNEYAVATIAKQAIGEYSYDLENKIIKKASPLLFSAYNSIPYTDTSPRGIALSKSDFVIPEFGNASTSLLTQCSLDGVCSGSTAVPYGNISSLSAALTGQLYAGIFNAKVLAFSDASLTASISIDGDAASAASAAFVSVCNANDDDHPDVSIWHRDGKVSVALSGSTSQGLTYEAKGKESFRNVSILGNMAPDAVAAGDIDQDGLDDFVIVKSTSLYILYNQGAGTFAASDAIMIPTQGSTGSALLTPVSAIAIGDISPGDAGLKDLVLISKTNRLIAALENTTTLR